jgi:hypothetical protein
MNDREANWQTTLQFAAGLLDTKGFNLGNSCASAAGVTEPQKLVRLRVTHLLPAAERWTADLTLPNAAHWGPIDVPFELNVEQPVEIQARPLTAPARSNVLICALANLPNTPNLYGATYLVQPQANAHFAIPDQVVAVTVYTGGVLTFYDAASVAIATVTSVGLHARPRSAVFASLAGNAPLAVLLHY